MDLNSNHSTGKQNMMFDFLKMSVVMKLQMKLEPDLHITARRAYISLTKYLDATNIHTVWLPRLLIHKTWQIDSQIICSNWDLKRPLDTESATKFPKRRLPAYFHQGAWDISQLKQTEPVHCFELVLPLKSLMKENARKSEKQFWESKECLHHLSLPLRMSYTSYCEWGNARTFFSCVTPGCCLWTSKWSIQSSLR